VLTTADSSTYNADYVIITIPLGVLKSSDASSRVTFSPALPSATANGISQLGFGNVVKIALLFPTAWWAPSYGATPMHYYGLAQAGTNRGLFTYFLNVHALANKTVLMTFALGAAADTAEGMSDADVWTQIRANLVKIFPNSVTVPPDAPQIVRSTWRANPNAQGVYTYTAVGTSKNTITNAFGRNVGGRLFFAGEHTSASFRGTVHGAFETGQAAARAVKACSAGSCPASSPSSLPTVAAASGTPNTITLKLFEDGASAANFAFPTSLTFIAGSTYTVTVPAGYFHDGLGNNVAQFTSTFTISAASRRAMQ